MQEKRKKKGQFKLIKNSNKYIRMSGEKEKEKRNKQKRKQYWPSSNLRWVGGKSFPLPIELNCSTTTK